MKLLVFFGLPGAGKSFVSEVARKYFNYHVYHGDQDIPEDMRKALLHQVPLTDTMRDTFFQRLTESVKKLEKNYNKLIVTQTFIKETYREQFLHEFPHAKFVLIETDTSVREKRLIQRNNKKNDNDYPLEKDYARKMTELFEEPILEHSVIQNTLEGEQAVKEQLRKIFI